MKTPRFESGQRRSQVRALPRMSLVSVVLVLPAGAPKITTAPGGAHRPIRSSLQNSRSECCSFNESRAMRYVREVVAFGPRPIGSANHKKLESYILAHLK